MHAEQETAEVRICEEERSGLCGSMLCRNEAIPLYQHVADQLVPGAAICSDATSCGLPTQCSISGCLGRAMELCVAGMKA